MPVGCRGYYETLDVGFLCADMSIQAGMFAGGAQFAARHSQLHVLINNAGGLFMNGQVSADGIEMTLALNHLGRYLLTRLLLPMLTVSAPSRIIMVSSVAHIGLRINFKKFTFARWNGYARSKLANLLFTYELARRIAGTGVTVNALHPGLAASGFGTNNSGLFPWVKPFIDMPAITNEEGARTGVYVASAPELESVTRKYFVKCRETRSSSASYDTHAASRLWNSSASMTGLDTLENTHMYVLLFFCSWIHVCRAVHRHGVRCVGVGTATRASRCRPMCSSRSRCTTATSRRIRFCSSAS